MKNLFKKLYTISVFLFNLLLFEVIDPLIVWYKYRKVSGKRETLIMNTKHCLRFSLRNKLERPYRFFKIRHVKGKDVWGSYKYEYVVECYS